jgi:hypothetical protein
VRSGEGHKRALELSRGLILGTVAALCLVVVPTPAAAYVDIGYDAEGDSTEESGAYDIRSSVRSVVRGPNQRNLRVATWINDADFWPGSYVFIDASSMPEADARLMPFCARGYWT